MKWLLAPVLFAVLLYAGGLAALSVFQRSLLYYPSADAGAPAISGVERLRIPTPDGEILTAWRHEAEDGQPTFLYFDGNGGAPENWPRRWHAIMDHGAGFLAVYYRGYAGSTGEPTELGLHIDARAGYDWLTAHGVAPDDIVIDGFSLGTGVASRLASEVPARALILEAPYTSAADVAQLRYPYVPARLLMLDQFRTRDWIEDVSMPILIVHGDADPTVPFEQGERLFVLAPNPKVFVRIPGGAHNDLVERGLFDHVWAFLETPPAH